MQVCHLWCANLYRGIYLIDLVEKNCRMRRWYWSTSSDTAYERKGGGREERERVARIQPASREMAVLWTFYQQMYKVYRRFAGATMFLIDYLIARYNRVITTTTVTQHACPKDILRTLKKDKASFGCLQDWDVYTTACCVDTNESKDCRYKM